MKKTGSIKISPSSNNIFEKVNKLLNLEKKDIKNFRFYHRGYAANSYKLTTDANTYFIKIFKFRKDLNYHYWKFSVKTRFNEEINKINLLNSIKNKHIITPKIVAKDDQNLIMIQKYFKGEKFYSNLIKNCNKFYFNKNLEKVFFEFGKFLANFHQKYFYKLKNGEPLTQLHGDLASKNIMFLNNNKIFLFDPNRIKGSVYLDLARFFINFHPFNFILNFIVSEKGLKKIKKSFYKGYRQHFKFSIKSEILKKYIINLLIEAKKYIVSDFPYKLKRMIINSYINYLIKRVKNDKIKIW